VCNKIGTYLKALAAYDNGVPFYAAAPSPSIDFSIFDGIAEVPIETRSAMEVTHIAGLGANGRIETVQLAPSGSKALNYGFDVTPARLVTGLITERVVIAASREALAKAFPGLVAKPTCWPLKGGVLLNLKLRLGPLLVTYVAAIKCPAEPGRSQISCLPSSSLARFDFLPGRQYRRAKGQRLPLAGQCGLRRRLVDGRGGASRGARFWQGRSARLRSVRARAPPLRGPGAWPQPRKKASARRSSAHASP
jgi:hypothetical protein